MTAYAAICDEGNLHKIAYRLSIDDILITLGEQYHLLRPVSKQEGLCLYFVLDKSKSNLALARRALVEVEKLIK